MIDVSALPVHIGIIMDGNGRWAKQRNLPRTSGHKEGLTAAKAVVSAAAELGIKFVTLYTFSTENWKRTEEEVGYLMGLIRRHLRAEFDFYKKNGIKIKHIGDIDGLPDDVRAEIIKASEETAHFTGMTVVLAINYGGRNEIVRGVKKMIADIFLTLLSLMPHSQTIFCRSTKPFSSKWDNFCKARTSSWEAAPTLMMSGLDSTSLNPFLRPVFCTLKR